MIVGASTSNFYPAPLEEALDTVLAAGFRNVEIFLNAPSEAKPSFIDELKRRCDDVGAVVSALHPYSSFMEPFFLFSPYQRRADDGFSLYESLFEAAARLDTRTLVIHGDKPLGLLSTEQSVERFSRLAELGESYGVLPAQENVVAFCSGDLSYLQAMKQKLGNKARFVLDFKQAKRCCLSPETVMDVMGTGIAHVHISDCDDTRDCLPPGQGTRDFITPLKKLKTMGYDGALMLELYRHNFESAEDLKRARKWLEEITCHF